MSYVRILAFKLRNASPFLVEKLRARGYTIVTDKLVVYKTAPSPGKPRGGRIVCRVKSVGAGSSFLIGVPYGYVDAYAECVCPEKAVGGCLDALINALSIHGEGRCVEVLSSIASAIKGRVVEKNLVEATDPNRPYTCFASLTFEAD